MPLSLNKRVIYAVCTPSSTLLLAWAFKKQRISKNTSTLLLTKKMISMLRPMLSTNFEYHLYVSLAAHALLMKRFRTLQIMCSSCSASVTYVLQMVLIQAVCIIIKN